MDAISCCTRFVPGGGRKMEGGGSRKGLDGGRDRTAEFLILINKGCFFLKRRISHFNIKFLRVHSF